MSINFDRVADRYDETRGGTERGARSAAAVSAHLPDSGRLLEIGVGTGLVAQAIGPRVVGADISADMLGHARGRLGARVAQADAAALPFGDASFVGAYAVWVFHLMSDPAAVLRELGRVLTPGGRCVVHGTERWAEDDPVQQIMGPVYETLLPGPRRDAPEHVVEAAGESGLDVVATTTATWTYEQSVAQAIHHVETRAGAVFWTLDDERWSQVVEPALDALRALPDPERPRRKRAEYPIVVLANR